MYMHACFMYVCMCVCVTENKLNSLGDEKKQVLHIKTGVFRVKESDSEVRMNVHAYYMHLSEDICTCKHAA